ncbi:uncharacterized protein VTP21DRAFT_1928 [Calcarisporiella thermophila]|uniref:uncharacterized protein n=1 Tax=Calcarisporiella thermophila TaxID=911321 RepID=UPI0037426637
MSRLKATMFQLFLLGIIVAFSLLTAATTNMLVHATSAVPRCTSLDLPVPKTEGELVRRALTLNRHQLNFAAMEQLKEDMHQRFGRLLAARQDAMAGVLTE